MLPQYDFYCIPLDASRRSSSDASIQLYLISKLEFPGNQSYSGATIRAALDQHPLLSDRATGIRVYVWDYSSWEANGRSVDPNQAIRATLTYRGNTPQSILLENFRDYLGARPQARSAATLPSDHSYDKLGTENFLNVAKAHDDVQSLLKSMLRVATEVIATKHAVPFTDPERMSVPAVRWLHAAAQSALLDILRNGSTDDHDRMSSSLLSEKVFSRTILGDIQTAIRKITKRLSPRTETECTGSSNSLLMKDGTSHSEVPVDDVNVAIQAALKQPLLARFLGIATTWELRPDKTIEEGRDYIVQLDVENLRYDESLVGVGKAIPTAFRKSTHVHPLSFYDLSNSVTSKGGCVSLNEQSGEPRYRATSVNSESQFVKQVILQAKNTLSQEGAEDSQNILMPSRVVDTRSPELLSSEQFGIPEPETAGVIISAPVEDLITPSGLKFEFYTDRLTKFPCYFLEDLWIGYRLDIKAELGDEFMSIHHQDQAVLLSETGKRIKDATEDYIEREQADDSVYGHSSTEIVTYKGMSTGQARDYLEFLGKPLSSTKIPNQPFVLSVEGYQGATPLIFGHVYEYRLRAVFLGGVSLGAQQLNAVFDHFGDPYRQKFPFYRARAFRPGELIFKSKSEDPGSDRGEKTILLTKASPTRTLHMVPTPIDLESARYHGLLLTNKKEKESYRHKRVISDIGKLVIDSDRESLNYFFDPEVRKVIIRVKVLNGNATPDEVEFTYIEERFCKLVKHWELPAIVHEYCSRNNLEKITPLEIVLRAVSRAAPKAYSCGHLWGCHRIEVEIPEGISMELSVIPLIETEQLARTGLSVSSSTLLWAEGVGRTHLAAFRGNSILPDITEQIIRVTHATSSPLEKPVITCESTKARMSVSPGRHVAGEICTVGRELDSEYAEFVGHVNIHAASTSEVVFEAKWKEIVDDPENQKYRESQSSTTGTPRSVIFKEYPPPRPTSALFVDLFLRKTVQESSLSLKGYRVGETQLGFMDQFSLQCSEDKVFYGAANGKNDLATAKPLKKPGRLNLGNQRRKLVSLQSVAVGRYAELFKDIQDSTTELRSEPILLDVASNTILHEPKISHVLPLSRINETTTPDGQYVKRKTYGIRVYVSRPWFQSGIGERLAIGCATPATIQQGAEGFTVKHVTQWGEDPVERPGLTSSMRLPRASDFVAIETNAALNEDCVDSKLYPSDVKGGDALIRYDDNILMGLARSDGQQLDPRYVSVASFALRYDQSQELWYCDVYVDTEFFGWCGLALYRHQPHAIGGRELSASAAWVYAAVLYDEPVVWIERGGYLQITIGPIYDQNVEYELDSFGTSYGVSSDLNDAGRIRKALSWYQVERARYFEGIVQKDVKWRLVKKRFGIPVGVKQVRDQ